MTSASRTGLPSWLSQGVQSGVLCAAPAPIGVALVWLFPGMLLGYPLVLLPLLLAGPVAQAGLTARTGLAAALVAGCVAGLVAATSLAIGSQGLGVFQWSLTGAASAPPMPPLPRVQVLPSSVMSWAQQDVLVFLPLLSVLLAGLSRGLRGLPTRLSRWLAWAVPQSLARRLVLGFAGLTLLTFGVGWVAFSALEEMHYRGHRLQLQVDWQRHLSEAQEALDAEHLAILQASDPSRYADVVDQAYAHLMAVDPHQDISMGRPAMLTVRDGYAAGLRTAMERHAKLRANSADRMAGSEAQAALASLRTVIDADMSDFLATDDLTHHERLITVMLAVTIAGAFGIWLSQQLVAGIVEPIRRLSQHLRRVAQGDFSTHLASGGPVELQRLIAAVNHMTGELDRLYAAERSGRATAEAMARRERELAAAKEFWANTVVHDLKTPLSVLAGYTEMLETGALGKLGPRQERAVEEMRRAADDLTELANDINDSFRLEAEALPMRLVPEPAPALLQDVAAGQARLKTRPPRIELEEDLPLILADARLISRVLKNLLGNAYKHAGEQAQVTLRACREQETSSVRFEVEDDGPGIPPEYRERIFERFVQGEAAVPGSGLGLAFCKLVVDRHGGRIWADAARQDNGARICFVLPSTDGAQAPGVHDVPGSRPA